MLDSAKLLLISKKKQNVFSTLLADLAESHKETDTLEGHIRATCNWLFLAQDATPDQGVAASYHLLRGWSDSYPETTGYIIPTLLNVSSLYNLPEARVRALAMADWEAEVQLSSGAIQSSTISAKPFPAVFNTGQVIFGWVAAYKETNQEQYRQAAERAATWLLDMQDTDGAWRKNLSSVTNTTVQTYNARTAWALILLGISINSDEYIDAGVKNIMWVLTQQHSNGWFDNNIFHTNTSPLLHTIVYVTEGLLEAGDLLSEDCFLNASQNTMDVLLKLYHDHARLHGQYNDMWQPTVKWRCIPGEAQTALVWLRLYQITGKDEYLKAGIHLNKQLMKLQQLTGSSSYLIGAVKGSHPIWGQYMRLAYPNWGAKFFLDSLLLQRQLMPFLTSNETTNA